MTECNAVVVLAVRGEHWCCCNDNEFLFHMLTVCLFSFSQSLSVPECRTDLVSNLVFFLFYAVFSYCCIFSLFKFKFVFINFCTCYFALSESLE